MRPRHVVVGLALIALLATVAVPGPVGSRVPSPDARLDPDLFQRVEIATLTRGTAMTILPQDPGARSAGNLDATTALVDPASRAEPPEAPVRAALPIAPVQTSQKPVPVLAAQRTAAVAQAPAKAIPAPVSGSGWNHDPNISWYGPGFYGNRTACGQTLTRTLVGVAHKTMPCGTLVTFRYKGVTVTVPVIDRGPYVTGRIFDLSHGACMALNHCFTGTIDWKLAGR